MNNNINNIIEFDDFLKVKICVGTILSIEENNKMLNTFQKNLKKNNNKVFWK